MIYFDNASTTSVRTEVRRVYGQMLETCYGNPDSLHAAGRQASTLMEKSRSNIASMLHVEPSEIIFTSAASESNTLAIVGYALANEHRGHHVLTSNVEHSSVRHAMEFLKRFGFEVEFLPINEEGIVTPECLKAHMRKDTILVSVMHVNNEMGAINPILELEKIVHQNPTCVYHVDCVQSFSKIDIPFDKLDMATISAHKIHGLKGSAILMKKKKIQLVPIIQGGMGIGVSLSNLASSVRKEGGMGVISASMPGFNEPDFETNSLEANIRALKKEIQKANEVKRGLLGVNIMVASRNYESYVKASVEAGADAIISGAGLPLDLPKYAEDKIMLAPIVSSAKACRLLCRVWDKHHNTTPDFVIIEGQKAGGHLGFKKKDLEEGTYQMLEQILKEVLEELVPFEKKYNKQIPVFVAGGIFTHEDIQNYIDQGASGVQMATRFIATNECDAHENFKQMILKAKKEDIVYVKSPAGFPGRAIKNEFVKRMETESNQSVSNCLACMLPCTPSSTPYCITRALIRAVKGDMENGLFFCGTSAEKIHEIIDVHILMDQLKGEVKEQ